MDQDKDKILSVFKDAGLLNHLGFDELRKAQRNIARLDQSSPILALEMLEILPNIVFIPENNEWNQLKEDSIHTNIFQKLESISHPNLQLNINEIAPHEWGTIYAINRALAQLNENKRMYWINYPDDGENGPLRGWALIFLSYAQFKILTQNKIFNLKASYSWTTARIDDVINTLKSLVLLSINENEISSIRQKLIDTKIEERSFANLLDAFGLVYWVDAEFIYDTKKDYVELINKTSQLTLGLFKPDTIEILLSSDYTEINLSISYQDQTFSKNIKDRGDWINWDYLRFMNEILLHLDIDYRFVLIEVGDQTAPIMFLSNFQYDEIQDKNLLPLEPTF